jgi:predicted O-methyltransferase YrrM
MSDKLVFEHLKQFRSSEGYWSTTDCINIAKDILDITKSKSLLEIGFNIGYSAAVWLENGIEDLIIIDIGMHTDTVEAIESTALHYKDKSVRWWIGDSTSEKAQTLDIEKVDISFIDGEHTYRAALSDSYLSIQYGADWLVYDDVMFDSSNNIHAAISKLERDEKIEIIKSYDMTWTGAGKVILCKVIK